WSPSHQSLRPGCTVPFIRECSSFWIHCSIRGLPRPWPFDVSYDRLDTSVANFAPRRIGFPRSKEIRWNQRSPCADTSTSVIRNVTFRRGMLAIASRTTWQSARSSRSPTTTFCAGRSLIIAADNDANWTPAVEGQFSYGPSDCAELTGGHGDKNGQVFGH